MTERLPTILSRWTQSMSIGKMAQLTSPKRCPDRTFPHQTLIKEDRLHVCDLCGKPRSRRYQMRHPLAPGQIPEPGTCSRPLCLRARSLQREDSSPRSLIVEVHHYYHSGHDVEATSQAIDTPEMHGESSLIGRAEVAGDLRSGQFSPKYTQRPLPPIREESPPPVNRLTKPTLYCY